MSTTEVNSIELFDRTENEWFKLSIVGADLYVNMDDPEYLEEGAVVSLVCTPYAVRNELMFNCESKNWCKFEVNISPLDVTLEQSLGVKAGRCPGHLKMIEWLEKNWINNKITGGIPRYVARDASAEP
jgi:hypothetical protein